MTKLDRLTIENISYQNRSYASGSPFRDANYGVKWYELDIADL
jgi:hypothetical protein